MPDNIAYLHSNPASPRGFFFGSVGRALLIPRSLTGQGATTSLRPRYISRKGTTHRLPL